MTLGGNWRRRPPTGNELRRRRNTRPTTTSPPAAGFPSNQERRSWLKTISVVGGTRRQESSKARKGAIDLCSLPGALGGGMPSSCAKSRWVHHLSSQQESRQRLHRPQRPRRSHLNRPGRTLQTGRNQDEGKEPNAAHVAMKKIQARMSNLISLLHTKFPKFYLKRGKLLCALPNPATLETIAASACVLPLFFPFLL